MQPGLIVLMLSILLGLQPITTDLYLPALPALTAGFGAPIAQAQLTLSALLLAFGFSQLAWGPLSDRFGRRPILLVGMSAYVLASLGSTLSASMEMLIVWRTVQGVAMGAGVMCARAIVRDLYTPLEGARVMSKGLSGLGVLACLCAPLGGALSGWFSWRIALLAVAIFGAMCLAVVALGFKETLARKNPAALQPAMVLRTWKMILRHPTFLSFSLLSAASYGGLFTLLAASSFVFIQVLGLSTTLYWLPRLGVRHAVALAGGLSLSGGTLMAGMALAGWHNVWAIMVPQCVFMLGHGIHQPCSQSGAVGPFPQAAGAASALNGFFMMVAAFAMGGWLGKYLDGTVYPMVFGIWFWSVLIALTAWTLVQKHGANDGH
jgi:DHA1 family bicyclomycin/chloramphenicol resistance-like MFS transporter